MLRRIGWRSAAIRSVFDSFGLPVREWERVRTDWLTIGSHDAEEDASVA
jgi:hypothetical protein